MPKFPVDAPRDRVLAALGRLGIHIQREGNHISMIRRNDDGSLTPLTLPNHRVIKQGTLRAIVTQAGISREAFMAAFYQG